MYVLCGLTWTLDKSWCIFLLATRFYFPNGNPTGKTSQDALVKKFTDAFAKYKGNTVKLEELGQVLKVQELFFVTCSYVSC